MNRANRPCRAPGCPRYAEPGTNTCSVHKQPHGPKRVETAAYHYLYTQRAWIDGRAVFLAIHPLCAECQKHGCLAAATVVDHIVPHRGDPALFYNQDNWQTLCKPCHDAKTATEDGGFGNRRRTGGRGSESLAP